jgi:hypothetical protein
MLGSCPFSYELVVPGVVESSVLVQVANEPLYGKVRAARQQGSNTCGGGRHVKNNACCTIEKLIGPVN